METGTSELTGGFRRRAILRAAALGGAGLASAALFGCGGSGTRSGGAQPAAPSVGASKNQAPGEPDYVTQARADGAPAPYNFPEKAGAPTPGGTLVVNQPTLSLGPWDATKSVASTTLTIPNTTQERLLSFKKGPALDPFKVTVEPELAQSWEQSPDGLTYTFRLQRNVKFQNVAPVDGRAFVAKDVVAVYERYRTTGVTRPLFSEVDTISAPDDYTVQIKLKRPYAEFIIPLASRVLPIYPIELVARNLLDTTPIGTGPLILTEGNATGGYKFKANADYWGGKPYMDGLEFKILPDPAGATAAFRAKQIDFSVSGVGGTKATTDAVLRTNPEAQVKSDPILTCNGYAFNLENPKFRDERIRRALSLAMDRKRIIDTVSQGYGRAVPEQGWTFVFDKTPTDAQLGKWWRYDPTEASALLSAAGASGFEFTMITSAPVSPAKETLQDTYRALGITMKLQGVPYGDWLNAWNSKKYAEAITSTVAGTLPTANFFYNDRLRTGSPVNNGLISDPQIDEWAVQQQRELNPQTKRETLKKIWDRLQDMRYRIEEPSGWGSQFYQIFGGQMRYYRFQGPYNMLLVNSDWGSQFAKAWLAK